MEQLVDPAVSRLKFERELAEYRKLEDEHISRGWWLIKAEFPIVFVVFTTVKLRPASIVFGALLDFTNYDFWPPSVKIVDPFTRRPFMAKELPAPFPRQVSPGNVQALMQSYSPDEVPFLCIPGVREYHQHPAHTGNSWLLHRLRGEGTLYFILDQLWKYGVAPIAQFNCELQIKVTGFALGGIPQ